MTDVKYADLTPGSPSPKLVWPFPEAYTVAQASVTSGLGRTKLYEELNSGRLKSFMLCGRRLILREDLLAWLNAARDGPD
jgi:excisionase family DNA binding protein